MPKYLVQASYTAEGIKGLLAEGGTSREAAARKLVESLGGTLESFYFTFGSHDVILIADMPDHASVVAAGGTVAASGALTAATTTVLLTADDLDAAAGKTAAYTPPKS